MLIGRKYEQEVLRNALHKDQSQFIAVYGRRRVGKTFLIRETFDYKRYISQVRFFIESILYGE